MNSQLHGFVNFFYNKSFCGRYSNKSKIKHIPINKFETDK